HGRHRRRAPARPAARVGARRRRGARSRHRRGRRRRAGRPGDPAARWRRRRRVGAAMRTSTSLLLARPLAAADRGRFLLIAGATPRQVRAVAAAEGGGAALAGAVAAGPLYALLWLVLGELPSDRLRLVPGPGAVDLLAWVAVVLVWPLGGVAAGAALPGRVS